MHTIIQSCFSYIIGNTRPVFPLKIRIHCSFHPLRFPPITHKNWTKLKFAESIASETTSYRAPLQLFGYQSKIVKSYLRTSWASEPHNKIVTQWQSQLSQYLFTHIDIYNIERAGFGIINSSSVIRLGLIQYLNRG